jgi:Zn-dependent protease
MFGKRFTLFRLLGFRVQIDASWALLALLVAWTLARGFFPTYLPGLSGGQYRALGAIGVAGLLFSILLHEFCHSLVARRYGLPIGGITLFLFGGVSEMEEEPPGARAEFLMAAAGPLSSLLLGGLFHLLQAGGAAMGWPPAAIVVLFYLSSLNVLLGLFNLLPAFPLDGGRMLRALLWGWGRNLDRATRTAASVGAAAGLGLVVLGVVAVVTGAPVSGVWWILIGLFLRAAAEDSYGQLRLRESVAGFPVSRFMTRPAITVPPSITLRDFFEGYVYHYHHAFFPVEEAGRLIGCMYVRSTRGVGPAEWAHRRVAEFMEPCGDGNTVAPEEDAEHALRVMAKSGNMRLVVRSAQGAAAGVLTLRDLLAASRLRD